MKRGVQGDVIFKIAVDDIGKIVLSVPVVDDKGVLVLSPRKVSGGELQLRRN